MVRQTLITSPDDPLLVELCRRLAERADGLDVTADWPAEQLALCGHYGVFSWFVSKSNGGLEWNEVDVARGYMRLAAACLTTTFIITQRTGAVRRIEDSPNETLREQLLPPLVSGESFATVAISHLTTSRRHLAKPAMRAEETAGGFVLDGSSAWVTGGCHAQHVVTGATLDNGQQVLVALPTDLQGVSTPPPLKLIGLSASHTGPLVCEQVQVDRRWLVAGPEENVMTAAGTRTGGLPTSALAIGLASAAIEYMENEANKRADLLVPTGGLRAELLDLKTELIALAVGESTSTSEQLRKRANSLVLRATQAALAAAKGTGYVIGHPVSRWCREAMFFLVWSCPQPVVAANLCELAGLSD